MFMCVVFKFYFTLLNYTHFPLCVAFVITRSYTYLLKCWHSACQWSHSLSCEICAVHIGAVVLTKNYCGAQTYCFLGVVSLMLAHLWLLSNRDCFLCPGAEVVRWQNYWDCTWNEYMEGTEDGTLGLLLARRLLS